MPASQRLGVAAEERHHGEPLRFSLVQRLLEDRSFRKREPHPQAQKNQHRARQKRNAPAKREKLPVGKATGEQQEHASGKDESGGRAELRKHSVEGALFRGSIFNREQHRASPFASEADSLAKAEDRQQKRRGKADRGVSGQDPMATVETPIDESAITSVVLRPMRSPKCPNSAEPTGRATKRDSESRQRRQHRGSGSGLRKKQVREDQHRRRRVDVKIEILNGRAHHAGKQHLARRVDRLSL